VISTMPSGHALSSPGSAYSGNPLPSHHLPGQSTERLGTPNAVVNLSHVERATLFPSLSPSANAGMAAAGASAATAVVRAGEHGGGSAGPSEPVIENSKMLAIMLMGAVLIGIRIRKKARHRYPPAGLGTLQANGTPSVHADPCDLSAAASIGPQLLSVVTDVERRS
jgi:hypothetical protein